MSKNCEQNCRLGKVGGEAVLEGVMMRCGDRYSIATRKEDGSVVVTDHTYTSLRKRNKFFNIPIIRGVVALIESFKLSFKVLETSAESIGMDLDEPETKFEKWLLDKFGDKIFNVIMGIAGVLGVVLAVGLFFLLPTAATKGVDYLLSLAGLSLGWAKTLCEGIIRIAIFVCYMALVSLMPDIRRTFEYHGAEHKTIACYEAGEELTPENAKKHTRFHARCGTSFIFVMLILSVLIFSLPFVSWDNIWLRYITKLLLMPIVCGLGFEFIQFAGKHDNVVTRALSAPGLLMQRISTREPDLKQLEIAITALKASMPDEFDRSEVDAVIEASKPAPETPAEETEGGEVAEA
ncbi:MAG: DUF1385 domain-containing protein [Clostridia bacterium]|nr:DUF1385 domain-containing protein [Clostridia bacterium]